MLELHVANTELSDAVVPISWCIDKETLEALPKGFEPQLVIIVVPQSNNPEADTRFTEYRTMVPLKDMMTYLELRHPGKNNIFAFISKESKAYASEIYLSYHRHYYNCTLLTNSNEWYDPTYSAAPTDKATRDTISVDVPEGVFAKKPPVWEQEWVNYSFDGKPEDQCGYRRRRLYAYTVQPTLLLLKMIMNAILFIVAAGYGSKALSFNNLLHPMSSSIENTFNIFGGTVFVRNVKDDDSDSYLGLMWFLLRKFWALPFMPYIAALILLAFKLHIAVYCGIALISVFAIFSFVMLIASGLVWKVTDFLMTRLFPSKVTTHSNDIEELQDLVCTGQPLPFKVSSLPSKRRTLKLRYLELKSKICKPFSA